MEKKRYEECRRKLFIYNILTLLLMHGHKITKTDELIGQFQIVNFMYKYESVNHVLN